VFRPHDILIDILPHLASSGVCLRLDDKEESQPFVPHSNANPAATPSIRNSRNAQSSVRLRPEMPRRLRLPSLSYRSSPRFHKRTLVELSRVHLSDTFRARACEAMALEICSCPDIRGGVLRWLLRSCQPH